MAGCVIGKNYFRKISMKIMSLPDFCAQAFLCRWDKAMVNIALMFSVFLLIVIASKSLGILFSPSTLVIDTTTATLATAAVIGLGYLRKISFF